MESLKGIFPYAQHQPPKRDFLKENVLRIRKMQAERASSSNNRRRPCRAQKPANTVGLSLDSVRPPMGNLGNLRKSGSAASISSTRSTVRDCSSQTTDVNDEMFLKDTIIRYPSCSSIHLHKSKESASNTVSVNSADHSNWREKEKRPPTPTYNHPRTEELSKNMDRHVSDLSEYLDKAAISRNKRTNSTILKTNKNFLNEVEKYEKAQREKGGGETIVLSDDDNSTEKRNKLDNVGAGDGNKDDQRNVKFGEPKVEPKSKLTRESRPKPDEIDPDCPDGYYLLTDTERLDALDFAKKKFKTLVDELNHLPMTAETLRVRNRKIQIEKELRKLDDNIMKFSRQKVFIKLD